MLNNCQLSGRPTKLSSKEIWVSLDLIVSKGSYRRKELWRWVGFKLEKAMAPHSSTLAGKIPWREDPGRLQSMRSLRVGHDWVTSLSRIGEGNGNPLQCSCLENPRGGGAWWAAIYGVAQSWTRLKWLSSSSRIQMSRRLGPFICASFIEYGC